MRLSYDWRVPPDSHPRVVDCRQFSDTAEEDLVPFPLGAMCRWGWPGAILCTDFGNMKTFTEYPK